LAVEEVASAIVKGPGLGQAGHPPAMKLFIVVLGCLLVVAFMTWMTVSLQKIQIHRDEIKHVQSISQQQPHAP
jgi:hypothetical protein